MLIGGGHVGLMRSLSSGNLIQSIQHVSITIGSSSTSNTATISSVTTANAFIVWGGLTGSNVSDNVGNITRSRIELTNATTVTAYRDTSDSNTVTVNGVVVELKSSAVQSVQQGTITLTAASSNTATISSVTTTNSFVGFLGCTTNSLNNNLTILCPRLTLTNSTTVTANRVSAGDNITVGYVVVEFKSGILNSSTQAFSISVAAASTSGTATISAITTGQTAIIYAGYSSSRGAPTGAAFPNVVLTDSTTVTATKSGTTANTDFTLNGTIVEFKSTDISGVDRDTITLVSGTGTDTIGAVNTSKTLVSNLGMLGPTNPGDFGRSHCTISLTNSTTITAANSNGAGTVSWEAIEFI